jgi:hypothetical protein
MIEARFTELVNLYLDGEISDKCLAELKAELTANPGRKAEFQKRCRLHQAMRLAMDPDLVKGRSSRARRSVTPHRRRSAHSSGHRRSGDQAAVVIRGSYSRSGLRLSHWLVGSGLAASIVFGFISLLPVVRDAAFPEASSVLSSVTPGELAEEDPLDKISQVELRRYASSQELRVSHPRASLAAQLRLMGLRPELTPEQKDLRPVSLAATRPPERQRNHAAMLDEVQKLTPMPTPRILRAESLVAEPTSGWPSGFSRSLASFK